MNKNAIMGEIKKIVSCKINVPNPISFNNVTCFTRTEPTLTSAYLKDILISATSSGAQSLNLSDAQVEFIIVTLNTHLDSETDVLLRDTKHGRFSISGKNLQEIAQTTPIEIEAIAKKLIAVFSENDLEMINNKFWLKVLTSYGVTGVFQASCRLRLKNYAA